MLIVFEGIDGTGKSTQCKLLARHFQNQGREVILSREPTDGPHGTRLRQSAATGRLTPQEELDLFHADRKEHVETLIQPALDRGAIVILDRYYFSTMAYQGSRGFDPQELRTLNESFAPVPDHLFLLDLPVELALTRIGVRDGSANEFEKKESLLACQNIFRQLDDPFVHHIDASREIDEIHRQIVSCF